MAKDPLTVLRDCILNNKDIREEEDHVYLGETFIPKNALTSFKSSRKGETPEEYYNLNALLFFLKNSSLPHVIYHAKAKAANIQIVKRYDRKHILKLLTGSSDNMTEVTPVEKRRNSSSSETSSSSSKRQCTRKVEKQAAIADPGEDGAQSKPGEDEKQVENPESEEDEQPMEKAISSKASECVEHLNTNQLSGRSRSTSSIDDPRSPSPLPSSCSPGTVDVSTQTDTDNQAATIQAFQVISNRVLKFLQDDLGLSRDEQEAILEGKKISVRQRFQRTKQSRCFVAIQHPLYEWDTVKEDASHVVSGQRINRKAYDIEKRYQFVLDNCLKRGESDLKDSLSILISHMRDLNKSSLSLPEVEASCKRTLEKCLTSAQEDFREMFESLLSVVQDSSPDLEIQRWMSESETELRKLLNSLMLSLQTLRDVSPSSRTLFHFPEPIVSIALNPTKVTHSVVLEIYVRLGLAELRRILIDMIGSIEKVRTATGKNRRRQSDGEGVEAEAEAEEAEEVDPVDRPPSTSSVSDRGRSADSPSFASSTLVESIKNDWSADEADCSTTLRRDSKSGKGYGNDRRTPLLNEKDPLVEPSTLKAGVTPEVGGGDPFSEFKDSIKSTLVTSFKKRIQEKIEASATTEECMSWLARTKSGFRNSQNK